MKRTLAISILFNLIMLAVTGFLLVRNSSLWHTTPATSSQEEQFRIPHGSDDGPFRLGVVICQLSSDPHSVATKVLERRQNHNPKFDVDLHVTEKDSIGNVVEFLQVLSSAGVTHGVRVVVPTSNGDVTLEHFNASPLATDMGKQTSKESINEETEQAAPRNR
jgi:hypothetical protein